MHHSCTYLIQILSSSQGASDRMLAAAEACYANDNAASLRQLGLTEMIEENRWASFPNLLQTLFTLSFQRRWDYGDTYLLTDQCLSNFVSQLREGVEIRTQSPVVKIETLPRHREGALKGRVLLTCLVSSGMVPLRYILLKVSCL